MPKIKEGTPVRLSDSLGRKLRVGDIIKDVETSKEYTIVSSNTAKSNSDAEQLDLMKKQGRIQAMFHTVKAWDEASGKTSEQNAAKLLHDLDEIRQKYDNLNTTFHACKDELDALKAQYDICQTHSDELTARVGQLNEELSGAQVSNDGLSAECERLKKELEAYSLRDELFDACGVPKCLADATTEALIDELKTRGVRGNLVVPQTVWTKYSLCDEKAGE